MHRFTQALDVWTHPFWRESAMRRPRRLLPLRARGDRSAARASRPTGSPAARTAWRALLEAREWDYVVGSVHFLRDRGVDSDYGGDWDVWDTARNADEVWRTYFETLAEAARSGLYDIMAHPDLVKIWGPQRPLPERDPRFYYEPAVEAIAEAGVAAELSTAGLRKAVGELYPASALMEMLVDAGVPIALSSDAHVPEDLGHRYDDALAFLADHGVTEIAVFEGRRRRHGAGRMTRSGIGWDSHRLEPGRPLILGGVADRARPRPGRPLRRRRPRARGDRRAARRRRARRHRPALPRHRSGVRRRRLARAAARGRRAAPPTRVFRRRYADTTLVLERPKLGRHRDAIAANLAAALGAPVNVKATTGEGIGFVGREEGVAALAVVTVAAQPTSEATGKANAS